MTNMNRLFVLNIHQGNRLYLVAESNMLYTVFDSYEFIIILSYSDSYRFWFNL